MTAEQLIDRYLEVADPVKPVGKTLAQKQGVRKAQRTKMRRSYESGGWLTYYYHGRKRARPSS